MRRILFLCVLVLLVLTGCSEAGMASQNLSKAADQFEIPRRVVFYNGITDKCILQIEGFCSVEFYLSKFVVTVKVDDEYLKHYLGRADNVFPFIEQLDPADVPVNHYRVIVRPSAMIMDVDLVD